MAPNPSLLSAAKHLDGADKAKALDSLLVAWADLRHEEVTHLIAELGADIDRSLDPIEGQRQDLTDNWLSVAGAARPIDVERLLHALDRASTKQIRALAPSLLTFPPDPRISLAMVKVVTGYTSRGANPAQTQALNVIAHVGDPRANDPLHTVDPDEQRSWLSGIRKKALKVAAGLPEPQALTPEDQELAAKVRGLIKELQQQPATGIATAPSNNDGAGLLEAVYQKPQDDEPRLVYMDWLLQQGDPRGRFIELQFKAKKNAAEAREERQLLKAHQSRWLGPIAVITEEASFYRGFLDTCLIGKIKSPAQKEALGAQEWRTVRRFGFAKVKHVRHPNQQALDNAQLVSLEEVEGATAVNILGLLEALYKRGEASTFGGIRYAEISDAEHDEESRWQPNHYQENNINTWKEIAQHPLAKQIRTLDLTPGLMGRNWGWWSGYGWLYESSLGRSLEHLTLGFQDSPATVVKLPMLFEGVANLHRFSIRFVGDRGYNQKPAEILFTAHRTGSIDLVFTRPFFDKTDLDLRTWVAHVVQTLSKDFPIEPFSALRIGFASKPTGKEKKAILAALTPMFKDGFSEIDLM